MTDTAPVSVVIPCYRCAATLERAVASVAQQSMPVAELVLVNDASPDPLAQLLDQLQQRYGPWVRVLHLPGNVGAASARNAGWEVATQPLIAFLDADDAWHPHKIAVQYTHMRAHPELALCAHGHRVLAGDGQEALQWQIGPVQAQPIGWRQLLWRHRFVTPSVMLRKSISMRFIGGQRHMEDHRLWLELAHAGLAMAYLPVDLVALYKSGYGASGLSADMWRMEQAELGNYRELCRQGKMSWPLWMVMSAYSWLKFCRRLLVVRLRALGL